MGAWSEKGWEPLYQTITKALDETIAQKHVCRSRWSRSHFRTSFLIIKKQETVLHIWLIKSRAIKDWQSNNTTGTTAQ